MLTKSDLSAIKSIVQDEVKSIVKNEVKAVVKSEIRSEVSGLKNEISGIKNDFSGVKNEISGLKKDISDLKSYLVERMDKNTQDLVDLITTLHNSHENVLENHEKRLTHIESISFKSN